MPVGPLVTEAPLYDRPLCRHATPRADITDAPATPIFDALKKLLACPDLASKRWIWEQYDHLVMGHTVQRPGGDAAVVLVESGARKALALTTDCTPRYCEADPRTGGMQAVAESWRNLTAVGALPLAVTDNLNFGNPEKPEIMGQFVGCVEGMGEACRALDYPIVSGNVSLYNETNGKGILPTPAIGGVGLIDERGEVRVAGPETRGQCADPDRRYARPSRLFALSARVVRPRGRRAAAGRSRRRAPQRRFRPCRDRGRPRRRLPRSLRRRAAGRGRGDGDGGQSAAPPSTRRPACPATPIFSARIRPAT